ncbi:Cell death regulator Aven, partial [Frankliniella fusca]
ASKMRQDKYRDRPKKHFDSSSKGGKGDVKDAKDHNQSKAVHVKDDSEVKTSVSSEHVEEIQSFSRRKLVSNWDRYEEPVDMSRFEDEVEVIGAHFEELLSMPISGGHLKMKHEHEWEKEKSELQMPWFQLDIQGVEQNLSTILFSKRQDLPSHIFSESQQQRMLLRAKRNATSLAEVNASILKVQNLQPKNPTNNLPDIKDNISKDISIIDMKCPRSNLEFPEVEERKSLENQDLDDILALHETSSKSIPILASNSSIGHPVKGRQFYMILLWCFIHACYSPTRKEIPASVPSEASITTVNPDQPTVSLDDWLDSILDD